MSVHDGLVSIRRGVHAPGSCARPSRAPGLPARLESGASPIAWSRPGRGASAGSGAAHGRGGGREAVRPGPPLAPPPAQRGHDVTLIDYARFPRDKVCGEGISPEAWRLLELGAAAAVRALRRSRSGACASSPPTAPASWAATEPRRRGLAVRRPPSMRRCSGGPGGRAEVREGVRVPGLRRDQAAPSPACAADDGGERGEIEARARSWRRDGRRSFVARGLGLLSEHRALRSSRCGATGQACEGLGDAGEMHVGGGGYCGIAPLPPTRQRRLRPDRRDMAAAAGDLEGFYRAHLRRRWPRLAERLQRREPLRAAPAMGPLALVARRGRRRALLVGDAAGFYDPFTGEGVTLALRSAELAAARSTTRAAPGPVAGRLTPTTGARRAPRATSSA